MDALRNNILLPAIHSLPQPIHDLGTQLLGGPCYHSLILSLDLSNTPCLKIAISKGLGLGIVAGSSVVKVPQILKIVSAQSAQGVSLLGTLLETTSFLIGVGYSARQGYAFTTYGETALIAVQNLVIALLVLRFGGVASSTTTASKKSKKIASGADSSSTTFFIAAATSLLAAVVGILYALLNPSLVDASLLTQLQATAGVLAVGSKLPQIWAIYSQGGTGQLSAFAVFNYLLGSLARVYTTITEIGDPVLLYGFLAGLVLNLVLAGQMIYYWNSPTTSTHASELGQEPAKLAHDSSLATASGSQPRSTSGTTKGPTTRRRG